ncbi:MAG: type II methionyl aminopeptidase [Nitrososphaerota archaeon]
MAYINDFFEAGKIAKKIREEIRKVVSEGEKLFEIAEYLENRIKDEGGVPAFPCNIGINEVAAHYSPIPNDSSIIPPNSIIKIDIGVHINGCIADTALTISLNPEYDPLVSIVNIALEEVLKIIKAGISTSFIGEVVSSTIKKYGFKPISNLTGHEIDRYRLHAGTSIPNVPTREKNILKENHIYAIEPFATFSKAAGEVFSGKEITIYKLKENFTNKEENFIKKIKEKVGFLPYSLRWFKLTDIEEKIHQKLFRKGVIFGYPVLIEKSSYPVAQAEHTVLVLRDGCKILTE